MRIEPMTFRLTVERSNQRFNPAKKHRWDLNPQPQVEDPRATNCATEA